MTSPHQNLDRSLVQGIAWTGAIKWGTQLLSWSATFIMARLLTPTDYGLIGMAMIYVGLAQLVSEGGVSAAVIQQRELSVKAVAELNGLAVMIGIVLCVITLALAGPISFFFGEPQVYTLISVLSCVFLIRSVQVVPRALMARDLTFRRLAFLEGIEMLALMVVTMVLALAHFGYWALALGGIIASILTSVLSLRMRPHEMSFPRNFAGLRSSIQLAWQVVTSQAAWYAYSNADFAVVGRVLGKAILGAYTFAWTIASIPVDRVSGMVTRVMPAFFAAVRHDPSVLRRYVLNLTAGLAMITFPACIGLALVAPEFVRVALGDKWAGAIAPLRILALYGAFRSIITPMPPILVATGHAKQSMYFSLLAVVVLPPAFYIGTRWGAPGVAMGWLLVYPILAIGLFLRYGFRAIGMTPGEYLRALAPAAWSTLAMAAAVLLARVGLPASWPILARLLCQVLIGVVVYGALVYTVQRGRLRAVVGLLKGEQEPIADTGKIAQEPVTVAPAGPDRLLVISYHFPPDPAVGSMRWRKLARYAAERGWSLDVIAQDPVTLGRRDDEALVDLPPGLRVYGVAPHPSRIERAVNALWFTWKRVTGGIRRGTGASTVHAHVARRESRPQSEIRWLPRERRDVARAYFAAMDHFRYSRWARDAARLALRIHDPLRHRAVITCGPPHPAHHAGVIVSRRTRLPLVLDLRDPWSLVQRLPEAIASPVWFSLARRGERRAVDQAALVVANTPAARNAMRQAYPKASGRIIAVPNGFDDDPVPPSQPGRRFTIAYAGSVYLDRDPRVLLRGAARTVRELGLTPNELAIEFMGEVQSFDGVPLETIAREEGIAEFVRTYPPGPRAQALEFLARGSMLAVLPQDSDMAIPAKIFEYMRFDAWMLVFAERGSATDLLLQGTTADLVRPGDLDAVSETLRKRYLQHLRGERGIRLSAEERLSRRTQAAKLFDALEGIVGKPSDLSGGVAPAPHVSEEGRGRSGRGHRGGVIPASPSTQATTATTA